MQTQTELRNQSQKESNKNTLSIAIITFNEERIIEKTLSSLVEIADEIIIVDSHSTDKTLEIAKKFNNVKIFIEEWKGYADQKNSAISKCSGSWILSLDADEILPLDLKAEIKKVLENDQNKIAYKIARKLFIGKKSIKYGGYFPDYQLRLFKNNLGIKFSPRSVHESIKVDKNIGEVGYLKNPLFHYAYENLDEYKSALKKYAKLAKSEINENKKTFPFPSLRSTWAFLYRYFFRGGFLEGKLGFEMVMAYSEYVYEKYSLEISKSF